MNAAHNYAEDHNSRCRVELAQSTIGQQDGIELARMFFEPANRQDRPWSSVDAARAIEVPVARVNAAFREARDEGLMELSPDGWRWVR